MFRVCSLLLIIAFMQKKDARKTFRALRKALTSNEYREQTEAIQQLYLLTFPPAASDILHTFLPIEKNREPLTDKIVRAYWHKQAEVVIPVSNLQNARMHHFRYTPTTKLQLNPWGIPEPVNAALYPELVFTHVLVPLLTFDKSGNRVGYGKGYYDQFLGQLPNGVKRIGLSLFPPVREIGDTDPHDIPLQYCVTPGKVYRF